MSDFEKEIEAGSRFEFGKNWQGFLSTLTDERIQEAENSIKEMLLIDNLAGKTFLDIGSGSGLFSLAAKNMGAMVHSFDFDPFSVACTQKLYSKYYPEDFSWIIEKGSILDKKFLQTLDTFDVVYSWGVLHHTGEMWTAIENAASKVKKNGVLFIAIYNDQGHLSNFWRTIKKFYCSGVMGKIMVSSIFIPCLFLGESLISIIKKKNVFTEYKKNRGMSITHDWFDWLGGLPFEVASVDKIFHFLHKKGFSLHNIKSAGYGLRGHHCNQFVFIRGSN